MACPMCHDTGHYYVQGRRKEAIHCDCQKGLEERIAAKSREIAATGLCQWGYRSAEEIARTMSARERLASRLLTMAAGRSVQTQFGWTHPDCIDLQEAARILRGEPEPTQPEIIEGVIDAVKADAN